ncbi:MAG: ATP-binding protein, partial [Defluviitaleaceae bacterium]|nr:ATP-binding protein [Defluviitaleaceae bacterium]
LADVTENRENAKRREEFFTNASHELKTPLTAIKGFNELMALNNKDEKLGKYIDGIARETGRLMSLIAHMLKLSELENAVSIEPVPLVLADVIQEVHETMSAALTEKAITFETKGNATIMADPEYLYELVKNLVENAVKYNHPGGKVTVTVESKKKRTLLTVSDNGIGISSQDQARIFERFYRVDKSRAVSRGGTGLGLSIVKHICALHGWKLSLKSKLGVGTDVVVEFPFMC